MEVKAYYYEFPNRIVRYLDCMTRPDLKISYHIHLRVGICYLVCDHSFKKLILVASQFEIYVTLFVWQSESF